MPLSIADQVIDYYQSLFDKIFSETFRPLIAERLKRNAVERQIQESADAASQSLIRFFTNERLSEQQAAEILSSLEALPRLIKLDDIANPRVTPERIVESKLKNLSCPESISKAGREAAFGVALNSVAQSLILFGPVMTEWKKTGFSAGFDPPQRFVSRLNEFSEKQDSLKASGGETDDELFKLIYLDHLIQRFFRIEAGTMQMASDLAVDLRDLFVMPRVLERPKPEKIDDAAFEAMKMMNLAAARQLFLERGESSSDEKKVKKPNGVSAFDQVRKSERSVMIGAPGGGKSTFFEWLQLQVASGAEDFIAGDQQAIPLLVRVRQLDLRNLPNGRSLIEKATASRDISKAMPVNWIERQMEAGRVLFMLDGLDETEPQLRDECVIPWLANIIQQYPDCRYLVSSRPVGYPPGSLLELGFTECDLMDFDEKEIAEYTRHWCASIRLARNEPEEEARREGTREGDEILASFKDNPYIKNLARNPLMLSAVCLVNYFEGGELPKDRARLYKLCVEGLLQNWDARRGIRSEFGLSEKLRVCRELAIEMQANDCAEYASEDVLNSFAATLRDDEQAAKLLENIRYRTGLLIERRPGVFAFAQMMADGQK